MALLGSVFRTSGSSGRRHLLWDCIPRLSGAELLRAEPWLPRCLPTWHLLQVSRAATCRALATQVSTHVASPAGEQSCYEQNPGYPGVYPRGISCTWADLLRAEPWLPRCLPTWHLLQVSRAATCRAQVTQVSIHVASPAGEQSCFVQSHGYPSV